MILASGETRSFRGLCAFPIIRSSQPNDLKDGSYKTHKTAFYIAPSLFILVFLFRCNSIQGIHLLVTCNPQVLQFSNIGTTQKTSGISTPSLTTRRHMVSKNNARLSTDLAFVLMLEYEYFSGNADMWSKEHSRIDHPRPRLFVHFVLPERRLDRV